MGTSFVSGSLMEQGYVHKWDPERNYAAGFQLYLRFCVLALTILGLNKFQFNSLVAG